MTSAFAATWRTGRVPGNGNTSAITVRLTNQKKNAYVKIHGYSKKNKEKSYRFHVTMRDQKGRWIWEGDIKTGSGGKKLKLGNDHAVYKLYLRHEFAPDCLGWGDCCPTYWGVQCTSNCQVY